MTEHTGHRTALAQATQADRAAQLYLEGRSYGWIARELNTTPRKVHRLLSLAREEWLRRASIAYADARAQELAKLDAAEAEAWAAWHRSIGKMREYTQSDKGTKRRTWTEAGDPKFLIVITKCVEQRCKILGVNAAEKHEHSGTVKHLVAALYGNANADSDTDGSGPAPRLALDAAESSGVSALVDD